MDVETGNELRAQHFLGNISAVAIKKTLRTVFGAVTEVISGLILQASAS